MSQLLQLDDITRSPDERRSLLKHALRQTHIAITLHTLDNIQVDSITKTILDLHFVPNSIKFHSLGLIQLMRNFPESFNTICFDDPS